MSPADDRAHALYGLPLDRFVPERDALAKELRAKGDRAGVAAAQSALDQVASAIAERRTQLRDANARLKDARRRRERAER
jgi:hypothetical protein